jgi:hypothetical protein
VVKYSSETWIGSDKRTEVAEVGALIISLAGYTQTKEINTEMLEEFKVDSVVEGITAYRKRSF